MKKQNGEFPAVKVLIVESFTALKQSLLNLFFISLISFAVGLVAFLLFMAGLVALAVATGLVGNFSKLNFYTLLTKITPAMYLAGGVILSLFIVLVVIIFSAIQISSVLAIYNYQKKPQLGWLFSRAFKLVMPMLLVSLLISFFTFGGLFLFIIPVFIVSFFISFAKFEVILAGKKWLEAIKASVQIISQNFGEVLIRVLLYIVGIMVLFNFPILMLNALAVGFSRLDPGLGIGVRGGVGLIQFFGGMLISWFGISYNLNLYKQASKITDYGKKTSLIWLWLIAIFGWLLAGLTTVGILKLVKSPGFQQKLEEIMTLKDKKKLLEDELEINNEASSAAESNVDVTITNTLEPSQAPLAPSCTPYKIREGEFASDKCYSQQDYDDLIYYLQRFNSAAFSYNAAISGMNITCSGSEFFKDECEEDKQQKAQAETDMANYRGIIQGIIARGI